MEAEENFSSSLSTSDRVPIARLNPLLPKQASSSIQAIVTLIWPYSSSNRTLTILLAEPDFRLRRSKGQVRALFGGSSAHYVSESGIGSGDEVILSLVGVEWVKDDSIGQTPGRGIEWELRYSETLFLQIKQIDSSKISLINIDHPKPRDPPLPLEPPLSPLPIGSPPRSDPSLSQRPGLIRAETNEWSSPAFIKRARDSYGALFDSGSDIFDEDGTVSGFGRKRTKFGRASGNWRYSSRSPSPEAEIVEEKLTNDFSPQADMRPHMTDEGCQTFGLDDDDVVGALASLSQQISVGDETHAKQGEISTVEIGENSPERRALTNEMTVNIAEMPPPPRPTLVTSPLNQSTLDDFNAVGGPPRTFPDPPRLLPVPSDALPLVSPLESSGSGLLHGYFDTLLMSTEPKSEWYNLPPLATEEVVADLEQPVAEDLYGLSPEPGAGAGTAEDAQEIPFSESDQEQQPHSDLADQYGHWQQAAMAATEQLYRSNSPYTQSPSHADGELELQPPGLNHESGPYYGHDLSRSKFESTSAYPDPNDENVGEQLQSELNEVRYPELLDLSNQNIQPQSSHGNSPAHISAAAVAMSRSQSVLSETIDLTEDSDEDGEADELNEDMKIGDLEDATGYHHRRKDPHYLVGIAEEDEGEYGEDDVEEEEYYDEEPDLEAPGYIPDYELHESGQDDEEDEEEDEGEQEEEEDEDETEGEYDEDEFSDEEEDASVPSKPAIRRSPSVIDLVSDEEDTDLPAAKILASAPPSTDKFLSEEEAYDKEDELDTGVDGIDGEDMAPSSHFPQVEESGFEQVSSPESVSTTQEGIEVGRGRMAVERPLHADDVEPRDAGNESAISTQPSDNPKLTNDVISTLPATLNGFGGSEDSYKYANGEVQYPVLPGEGGSIDFATDKYPPQSHSLANDQLPTPEATQLTSADIISANMSFNSTIEHEPASGNVMPTVLPKTAAESLENLASEATHGAIEISVSGISPLSGSDIVQPPTTPISSRLRSSTVEVHSGATEGSPSIFEDSPRRAPGYDASAELVMAELDSAEKKIREKLTPIKPTLLARGLITDFADFTPLKLLRFHQDKKLDNISVATTRSSEPRRASKGLRHYFTSFNVIDPSTPSSVAEIQIFRPYQEALPMVDVGDSVLLRNFAVRSEKPGFALRSEDASSWLVFMKDGTTQSKGPPVEFGSKEVEFAERLRMWFGGLDADGLAKVKRANADKAAAAAVNAKVH